MLHRNNNNNYNNANANPLLASPAHQHPQQHQQPLSSNHQHHKLPLTVDQRSSQIQQKVGVRATAKRNQSDCLAPARASHQHQPPAAFAKLSLVGVNDRSTDLPPKSAPLQSQPSLPIAIFPNYDFPSNQQNYGHLPVLPNSRSSSRSELPNMPKASIYANSAPASSGFSNYQPTHPHQHTNMHFQQQSNHTHQPQTQMQSHTQPHSQFQFNPYVPARHPQLQQQQQQSYVQQPPQQPQRSLATIPPPQPALPPFQTMDPKFLEKYIPNPVCLGSGGFGFVTIAVRKADAVEVAVKFILREKVPQKAWARDPLLGVVPTEVYILKNANHQNVIKYLDYFSDKVYLYLVTELHGGEWGAQSAASTSQLPKKPTGESMREPMKPLSPTLSLASTASTLDSCDTLVTSSRSGSLSSPRNMSTTGVTQLERRNSCDLFECIEFYQRFTEEQARHVFTQIVSAVAYLAENNIIHRDIKDENILIDRDFNVKLIDFGSATFLNPQGNVVDGLFLGTLQYAAPEILSGKPYRGTDCEVWSLGCCLYIMLAGEAPFETPSDVVRLSAPLAPRQAVLSNSVSGLICWMLEKNPRKRASIADVMRHPWLVGGVV
ncbi:hypothetical protein BC830DRAFT_1109755 [Chytriomyces sp. MP71]|nr:hypothetical protein BC830DRAFT_1109755 [Chytriomyces sp. MP71]